MATDKKTGAAYEKRKQQMVERAKEMFTDQPLAEEIFRDLPDLDFYMMNFPNDRERHVYLAVDLVAGGAVERAVRRLAEAGERA